MKIKVKVEIKDISDELGPWTSPAGKYKPKVELKNGELRVILLEGKYRSNKHFRTINMALYRRGDKFLVRVVDNDSGWYVRVYNWCFSASNPELKRCRFSKKWHEEGQVIKYTFPSKDFPKVYRNV